MEYAAMENRETSPESTAGRGTVVEVVDTQ